MPFTALHLGPGLLLKAAAPRYFSLVAFGATQVAIDLEPLFFLLAGEEVVHRTLHTVLAACAVGIGVAGATLALRRLWRRSRYSSIPAVQGETSVFSVLTGGLLGALSHLLFDGLMHADTRPFLPFAEGNPLLGLMDLDLLHAALLGCAAVAAVMVFLRPSAWRLTPSA